MRYVGYTPCLRRLVFVLKDDNGIITDLECEIGGLMSMLIAVLKNHATLAGLPAKTFGVGIVISSYWSRTNNVFLQRGFSGCYFDSLKRVELVILNVRDRSLTEDHPY